MKSEKQWGDDVQERSLVTDVARINELWKAYAAAVTAGDLELWMSLWIEDGIQVAPSVERRAGKKHIRFEMEPIFDRFDQQLTIYPDEIRVLGDQAYAHGTRELVMTPKEGGSTIDSKGKFLAILQRQLNGSWKIAIECFNLDVHAG